MTKLNIGCGNDIKPKKDGWINLDILNRPGTDIVINVLDAKFKSEEFEYIYASDILEHFTRTDADKFLSLCYLWLKKGGILHLRLPNMETLVNKFIQKRDENSRVGILHWTYGNFGDDKYDMHQWGYTPDILKRVLIIHKFTVVGVKNVGYNMAIDAKKV